MSQRDIKKYVERLGLGLAVVSIQPGTAGHQKVTLRAASGAQREFLVDTNPDRMRADPQRASEMKRFGRENPAAPTESAMQQAFVAVAPAPAPASTPSPQQESLPMTSSAPATPTRKPLPKKNMLDMLQVIQLSDWIRAYDFDGKKPTTHAVILADAVQAFQFNITVHNIAGMMEQLGLKLTPAAKPEKPKKVVPPTDNEIMLARHLRDLMAFSNFRIPSEVEELAGHGRPDDIS